MQATAAGGGNGWWILLRISVSSGINSVPLSWRWCTGSLLHFNTMRTVADSNITEDRKKFILQLRNNFSTRFDEFAFHGTLLDLSVLRSPSAQVESSLLTWAWLYCWTRELCGADSLGPFWVAYPKEHCALKTMAIYLLTVVGSRFYCEAAFS